MIGSGYSNGLRQALCLKSRRKKINKQKYINLNADMFIIYAMQCIKNGTINKQIKKNLLG